MTDGINNGSKYTSTQVADLATSKGVPVFTIGLGTVDEATLKDLAAKTGGQYYYAPTSDALRAIYDSIANIIKNQYVVKYNTPDPTLSTRTVTVDINNGGSVATTTKTYAGCTVSSSTNATFDASNSLVRIPVLQIEGDVFGTTYSVDMQQQQSKLLIFTLTGATYIGSKTITPNTAIYNASTGAVRIPYLTAVGDTSGASYSINMQQQNQSINFSVTGVTPN